MIIKMPVDKFGHTDVEASQRVISGGVTLSQAINTFLRLDGTSSATGDINLDSHKLVNVLDPTNAQDGATKNYVDTHSDAARKTYVGDDKVSKSCDNMHGDLLLSSGSARNRLLGCNDLEVGQGFTLALGNNQNLIQYYITPPPENKKPLTMETTAGFLVRINGSDICQFGSTSAIPSILIRKPIRMNNNRIMFLAYPSESHDAATKGYVDTVNDLAVMKTCFKTVTGKIANVPHADHILLTFPPNKRFTDGRIRITELWVERARDEWFSTSSAQFSDHWVQFHRFTRGPSLMCWFAEIKEVDKWTRNYRLEYIELD